MKKNKNTKFIVMFIVFILILFIGLILPINTLIIYLGIRMAKIVSMGLSVVGIVGSVLSVVSLLVINVKRKKLLQSEQNKQTLTLDFDTGKQLINDETLLEQLRFYKESRPFLKSEIDTAIKQINDINKKQARLLKMSQDYKHPLEQVNETMQTAEDILWNNISRLVRRVSAWDTEESLKTEQKDIYDSYKSKMQELLNSNDGILIKCEQLLYETLEHLDAKDNNSAFNEMDIDAMIGTMRYLKEINDTDTGLVSQARK